MKLESVLPPPVVGKYKGLVTGLKELQHSCSCERLNLTIVTSRTDPHNEKNLRGVELILGRTEMLEMKERGSRRE